MSLTCEFCRRQRNNHNEHNWTKHIESCQKKNKRQKVNLDGYFIKKNKISLCK